MTVVAIALLASLSTAGAPLARPAAPVPPASPGLGPAFEPVPLDPPIEPSPLACELALALARGEAEPGTARGRLQAIGRPAAVPIQLALETTPTGDAAVALLEALAAVGDFQQEKAVRPYLFDDDPDVALAATYALARIDGARAAPVLEFLIRSNRPAGQTLLSIEQLAGFGLASSFSELARYAEDESHPVELRAIAARKLPSIDLPRTRKWLRALVLPPGTSLFFRAELDRLLRSLATTDPASGRPAL